MTDSRRFTIKLPPAIRWIFTVALLLALALWLDIESLINELSRFSLLAVGLALLVSVAQVVLSAWRWRYTARCLGLGLAMKTAVREYYLATFLNQCLPGGVLGDVNRAWRHGSGSGERRSALHGVMIERLSGQLVMFAVAISAGVWLATSHPDVRALAGQWHGGLWIAVLVLGVAALVALATRGGVWQRLRDYLAVLGWDIYRGLLRPRVLPIQLLSSLLVVATYLAVFWLLAFSAYDSLGFGQTVTLLALCSLLLLAMVIPLTVAGWGVREGVAALLWPLAGLPAEQGVALSVGYGLTILLSSLPGSLFVFSRPGSAG
jgi:uncharacterized membrane protein YbhN (UPF0104 family)